MFMLRDDKIINLNNIYLVEKVDYSVDVVDKFSIRISFVNNDQVEFDFASSVLRDAYFSNFSDNIIIVEE